MTSVQAFVEQVRTSWRPPPRRRLSEWADEFFYLSPESAADPGRWHTLPYQRGIMDAYTDPAIEHLTLMKSSRVGYTKILGAAIGYHIHQDPCSVMLVQPTLDDAREYSKDEIAPMLRDCQVLRELVPEPKTRDSNNTILNKRFPGGTLSLVGANSARGFRRVSRRVVLFDETDGYPPSAGAEGDQIKLGIRRTEYFWNRKIVTGSTPTTAGISRIHGLYLAGDQRRYYVPCPHCGFMQVLQLKHFRWPKHPERPKLAVVVCIDCGAEIDHAHKREMVEAGEWRPGPHPQFPDEPPPGDDPRHASFHIWAAYSYSPNATWGQLCAEFVEATHEGPESLKTFVNTILGEVWQDRGDAPEWRRLYERREPYALGSCPWGVLFLTAGVDVQKDRLIYEIVGWGRGKTSWSIEIGVLHGDTSDLTKGPWPALNALLGRTYPHAGGREISISMMAVDSGFNTQVVYNWARTHPMSRVIAVRGVPTAHVLIGAPSRVDVTIGGRKLKRGYKVWPIATNVAKSELYGWLGLQRPTDEARSEGFVDSPGYCHFPEHGEEYFQQLTAEQLVPHKSQKGFMLFVWEMIPGRQNHHLDARVYARAAAAVVGLDRFREKDWAALEAVVGEAPGRDPDGADNDRSSFRGASTTPPTPTPPTPPRKPTWIGPRRGSWLRRER